MTDRSVNETKDSRQWVRSAAQKRTSLETVAPSSENKVSFFASLDKPLLMIVATLLVIGMMMVYSTTFDWSYFERGSPTAIFLEDHAPKVLIGIVMLLLTARIDYRFWKPFATWLMLVTIGALIAVIFFGDDTFGARRSLIGGRFQPSELAEFTIIVYMAAWLGAKQTRVNSFWFGFIPFAMITGVLSGLVAIQPDLSSAAIIGLSATAMYFLAGAKVLHLAISLGGAAGIAVMFTQTLSYAQDRVTSFGLALSDPTQANYHTQQAIIAFLNGGWAGVGLGESKQKFFLPAPHTDSIFAVIGEELGVLGAMFVVILFVALVIRGFMIARQAVDPFGSLLAAGFTFWVAIQALVNIAVMTALIPSTGLPLPFISYGGSALFVLMIGVGLVLSVQRVSSTRQTLTQRRTLGANFDRGWGNRRTRLSRTRRSRGPSTTSASG
ncbi:stage V sporulation protein E [Anaerolineales bacterium]